MGDSAQDRPLGSYKLANRGDRGAASSALVRAIVMSRWSVRQDTLDGIHGGKESCYRYNGVAGVASVTTQ